LADHVPLYALVQTNLLEPVRMNFARDKDGVKQVGANRDSGEPDIGVCEFSMYVYEGSSRRSYRWPYLCTEGKDSLADEPIAGAALQGIRGRAQSPGSGKAAAGC